MLLFGCVCVCGVLPSSIDELPEKDDYVIIHLCISRVPVGSSTQVVFTWLKKWVNETTIIRSDYLGPIGLPLIPPIHLHGPHYDSITAQMPCLFFLFTHQVPQSLRHYLSKCGLPAIMGQNNRPGLFFKGNFSSYYLQTWITIFGIRSPKI